MTQEEIANYQMSFFVNYELAKELREKGFDKPCFAYFRNNYDSIDDLEPEFELNPNRNQLISDDYFTLCPTIDQVIEWFIEKYNMRITQSCEEIHADEGFMWFPSIDIIGKYDTKYYDEIYQTRKEAQIAGIKHALTLIK